MSAVILERAPRAHRLAPRAAPLEIVATRHQRRSRPRAIYAIATIVGVFAILLTQLMLSIVLSDGAYRLTALEAQRVELDRSAQVLTEDINVYDSAQNVAANAESLGMVVNMVSPAFLLLADGSVQGAPTAAGPGSGLLDGRETLVSNVLLAGLPLINTVTPEETLTAGAGVPLAPTPLVSVPSASGVAGAAVSAPPSGALPSPVTR